MPVIPSLALTNQLPGFTYTASVVTSASFFADGLGNQLYSASLTSSFAVSASYAVSGSNAVTASLAERIRSGSVSSPKTGSIFFSGSFLYVYTGVAWKSASLF